MTPEHNDVMASKWMEFGISRENLCPNEYQCMDNGEISWMQHDRQTQFRHCVYVTRNVRIRIKDFRNVLNWLVAVLGEVSLSHMMPRWYRIALVQKQQRRNKADARGCTKQKWQCTDHFLCLFLLYCKIKEPRSRSLAVWSKGIV
jgi:hypothetical protein